MRTALNRTRPRLLLATGSLLAALVVALLPLPPAATAAAAADTGAESSAVTKTGTKGKYDDFSHLKVTVHQTKNLRSQGVRISWEGGAPTQPDTQFNVNFLQIMQCWGDDPAGPTREQCEFGATGVPLPGIMTSSRRVASTGSGVGDPGETQYTGTNNFVPFRPVDGSPTTSSTDYTYFGPLDTNEQIANRIFANGTGEVGFEVQDGSQADQLGCGVNTAPPGGAVTPRSCWLVVVPRGTHDADGSDRGAGGRLDTSPLSATNWAQRMVFRLDFQPIGSFCRVGQEERPVSGSELVDDAVASWGPKLCSSTGSTFVFNREDEESARGEVLSTTTETPGLGVTVDPVVQPGGGPSVVHAPVALSGLAFAFFIEGPSGVVHEMNLTPRLVAKMLTHSYVRDVPWAIPVPEHVKGNPDYWTQDPEFEELNPEFPDQITPMSLIVPQGNSDTTRMIWHWLQADKDARDFLAGKEDPWGMKLNPYFKDLGLDTALNNFPKVDDTRAPAVAGLPPNPPDYGIIDLAPYAADLHDGALRTRRGHNGRTVQQDVGSSTNPRGLKADEIFPGRHAVMAVVDAASAERYGLPTAALRNADGNFVRPSVDTLRAGVDAMQPWPDDPAVLKPDPARAKGQAYPLAAVTYAAASVNQDAQARKAYADFIRFAAGPGQTPGRSEGELPPGYAPLSTKLRQQAEAAADALERGAPADGPSTDGPAPGDPGGGDSGGPASGADAGGTSSGTGAGGASSGGAGGDTGGADGDPGAGPSNSSAAPPGSAPPSAVPQQNVAESGITPGEALGVIRWVLLAVLVLGGAAALAGPVFIRFAQRRIP
ncbi:hypothetical protein ACFYXS_25315 [Streptomyces sp. NPDC002574]|uniref:hypothetical protein n=1 Tax=Streptomyces sp. NPDC002574 TaxID=3364652 RepID=UPI0036A246CA